MSEIERIEHLLNSVLEMYNQHISETHQLLAQSEKRIKDTNEMVHALADTCRELKTTYAEQIEKLSQNRDNAMASLSSIIEQNKRLLDENEAYYKALKEERLRYDRVMDGLMSTISDTSHHPLVHIDQK